MEGGKHIMLVAQKSAAKDEPTAKDLYEIGCVANILQMLKLPDGTVKVLVEGAAARARHYRSTSGKRTFRARSCRSSPADADSAEIEAMRRAIVAAVRPVREAEQEDSAGDPHVARRASMKPAASPTPSPHICRSSSNRSSKSWKCSTVNERLEHLLAQLEAELDILQVEKRIRGRVKRQMEKSQREYYLNEQVKAIQKELGEGEEGADLEEMEKKIKAAQHAEGSQEEGRRRVEEAEADVADVGRSDGRAQLHRHAGRLAVAQEEQDQQRPRECRARARRGPLRAREGQGTHPRVSRGAAARRQGEGADPVPRRRARGRQDLARPVDCARDQPQVRPHVAGRRARRSGDPRPSPHLYRFDAGQDPAEA